MCEEACSSSQCKSKRVTLALFGRSCHFRNLRLWLKRQCSSVFCVSSAAVEFKSVADVLFQPLDMETQPMAVVLEPVDEDDVDDVDGVGTHVYRLTPGCFGRLRWSLSHFLSYYRSDQLCQLERLLVMHVDRQRSLDGVYGDSFVEDCETYEIVVFVRAHY